MNEELKTTTALVKTILIEKPYTRNSDNILYTEVLEHIGQAKGVNINRMPIGKVLTEMRNLNLPTIETVGRCRRKIQETHPELRPTIEVAGVRSEREKIFREYAREKNVD